MKKKYITIVFILLSVHLTAKSGSLNVSDSTAVHPSLLIKSGDELLIRQSVKNSQTMKNIHDVIISESDQMLNLPCLKYEKIGKRLLDVSRECLRRVFYLSYSYRMTGDEKYAKRADDEMLAVCSFADWNPTHFLDVAEMTMGVAIGYDWTYNYLSPSSRDIISKAIISHGILPSMDSKYNSWLAGKNNWNQVCNAGILFGAIAVNDREPELSKTIIDRSLKSVMNSMAEYEPDGTYPEGYNYWSYGTSFNVMLISAAESFFGKELFPVSAMPGFIRSALYIVNMEGPTGGVFNYSDGDNPPEPNSTLFWFAAKTNDAGLLWNVNRTYKIRKLKYDRLLPAAIIWQSGANSSEPVHPTSNFWIGQGINPVCLMRTSWTDPNAIYLGFKAGTPSASHGHMDVGSFVMEANGERWASDFGKQEYELLESKGIDVWSMGQRAQRWSIFRYNNLAHSTLTFNDSLQRLTGNCKMESWSDNPANMFATSDITPVYAGQVKKAIRTASLIDKSYVSINDEIETLPFSTKVRWTLLTEAIPELNQKDNEIVLTKNGKKLLVKIKSTTKVTLKTWSTRSANAYDMANPGTYLVGFEAQLAEQSKTIITVLLTPEHIKPVK
jgi:hypothetical protein